MSEEKHIPLTIKERFTPTQILDACQTIAKSIVSKLDINKSNVLLVVMDGAFIFGSDVSRMLPTNFKLSIGSIKVKSYVGTESKDIQLQGELPNFIDKDTNVIIVDDIFDTGKTLEFLVKYIQDETGAVVNSFACLLKKKNKCNNPELESKVLPGALEVEENEFVIGYGMDVNGAFRNLPCICVLENENN